LSGNAGTASNLLAEQAGSATRGQGASAAVSGQQSWDGVRLELQRSYVMHLPGIRSLAQEQRNKQRDLLQQRLTAQPACCAKCGSNDMQDLQPATILYIANDSRFHLTVPWYKCAKAGCGGTFSPSPLVVGCFPAMPKASWDVSTCSEVSPAHWLDICMLQLADTFISQGGLSLDIHQFAAAIHKQHELNGCAADLKLDWFKQQLLEAIHVRKAASLRCAVFLLSG
jgi:hypothetical protein